MPDLIDDDALVTFLLGFPTDFLLKIAWLYHYFLPPVLPEYTKCKYKSITRSYQLP